MTATAALALWRQVVVLNCGGTINMSPGEGARPGEGVEELLSALGPGFDLDRLVLERPFLRPPDSSAIGEAEWAVICARLREIDDARRVAWTALGADAARAEERGGVVVAHGTDTLQVTSMVAALELAAGGLIAPVVFTGSHSPPGEPGSDALNNLAKAIFAATRRAETRPHNLPPGVYVLLGEDIHIASRLSKVSSLPDADGRYFFSFPGPVAQMTSKDFSVKLQQGLLDRLELESAGTRCPRRTGPWGRVEHRVLDAFSPPGVLDDLRARMQSVPCERRTGLVVQGDFRRNPALPALRAALLRLVEDGVLVAIGSKGAYLALCPTGPVEGLVLLARSLSHAGARTKLSFLLGCPLTRSEVGEALGRNLVGEVFETRELPRWIKYEAFADQRPGVEVVVAWPDLPAAVLRDARQALLVSGSRKMRLHVHGFGYGHIPIPNAPLAQILDDYTAAFLPELGPCPPAARLTGLVDWLAARLGERAGELLPRLRERYQLHPVQGDKAIRDAVVRDVLAQARSGLEARLAEALDAGIAAAGCPGWAGCPPGRARGLRRAPAPDRRPGPPRRRRKRAGPGSGPGAGCGPPATPPALRSRCVGPAPAQGRGHGGIAPAGRDRVRHRRSHRGARP